MEESNSPMFREETTPANMLSLTFVKVRIMSMTGSTEMTRPAIVTGKFSAPNTIKAAKVAPPPTPATPKELIVTTKINVNTKPMLNQLRCSLFL